ncbi:hypothetical protein [Novosphingobium sp. Gsoil 351]|uniref:hypothetical protein n=1 Tax=Novosphingobium sp. Gsoil 351 TaxID=2675225 RepID=UPI0012B48C2F|nr:hypothetical protein [Novosphingobium sp. Gsoil 351]QGN54934.1 hypothetical protein GKE62_10600 [Novosphingobium sp. Gsoil 351]
MIRTAALFALSSFALLVAPGPALAQADGEKVNQLIVYGDDPCPQSSADQITVCARKGESERYRIPEPLRGDPLSPKNEAWTDRVQAYETVGAQGISSCSPVGSGGATGCMAKLIDTAYAEKRQGSDTRFGALIEAERAKRLSTIDADAAATQARVEQLEKEYDAKIKAERDAETPGTVAPLPAPGN